MDLPTNVQRVLRSVLGPKGRAAQDLRNAVAERAESLCQVDPGATAMEGPLGDYVDKVSLTPYKVIDRDIDALRESGLTEDQIFEVTVATALGSARARFEKTLALIEEEWQ